MPFSIATYWNDGSLHAIFGLGDFPDAGSAELAASRIVSLETQAGEAVVRLNNGSFIPVELDRVIIYEQISSTEIDLDAEPGSDLLFLLNNGRPFQLSGPPAAIVSG